MRARITSSIVAGTTSASRSRATISRSPSRRTTSASWSERSTSSTKNGFPSVRRTSSARRASGSSSADRSPRAIVTLSAGDRAARVSRVWNTRSPSGGAYPGRYVTIMRLRWAARLSASVAMNSSVARSTQ